MRRNLLLSSLLLAATAGCATGALRPGPPEPGAYDTVRLSMTRLRLQLRQGSGAAPCKSLGGGVEACPVLVGPGGVEFVTAAHIQQWEGARPGGPALSDEAFSLAYLALAASADDLSVKWLGDKSNPKLIGVVTRDSGGDDFAAARLLVLPEKVEALVDDLGLQFLAAIPNRRTLLVLRDEDPAARALAELVMAEQGRLEAPLAPATFFQVTPDGIAPRETRN